MKEVLINNIIDSLIRVLGTSEINKEELLKKYSKMGDKKVIEELSVFVFEKFKDNKEMYDYFLNFIMNINPEMCKSIDDMKKKVEEKLSNNESDKSLEENHKIVLESLEYITSIFNEYGIDYYVVGSLPCFIKTSEPLFRHHDNINIIINEDNIDVAKMLIESSGYLFHDDRFVSLDRYYELVENPNHSTIEAVNPFNDFYISFIPFRRQEDDSMTTLEYLHIPEQNGIRIDVIERNSSKDASLLQYDEEPTSYGKSHFRTSSIEYTYELKCNSKKPKDVEDVKVLEKHVDKSKLKELRRNTNKKNIIKNVQNDVIKL